VIARNMERVLTAQLWRAVFLDADRKAAGRVCRSTGAFFHKTGFLSGRVCRGPTRALDLRRHFRTTGRADRAAGRAPVQGGLSHRHGARAHRTAGGSGIYTRRQQARKGGRRSTITTCRSASNHGARPINLAGGVTWAAVCWPTNSAANQRHVRSQQHDRPARAIRPACAGRAGVVHPGRSAGMRPLASTFASP
jgi:hypothetical protein